MSGAEALLALGVAANVLQFVEFTGELCTRIREYSNGPGVPRKLALQADQLDHLLEILKSLCHSSQKDSLERQIVAACQAQAEELYYLLESLQSSKNGQDRWWKNAKKALKSLSRAEKIKELQTTLDSLISTLSLQLQVDMRGRNQTVEANTISILQQQYDQSKSLEELRQLSQLTLDASAQHAVVKEPIWLVPIGRNPEFVGRASIIEELQERLGFASDAVRKAVLCGLGGVGKSQIALEYAYREKDVPGGMSVFWIHATSTARFVESFKRIASELKVPGRESPEVDILQLARDYLEIKYKCDWLMVVDNVDDRAMLFEDQSYKGKCLCEYIPQTSRGAILYTTRNREVGVDLSRDPIEVPPMNLEDARSLLGPKIRAQSTEAEQLELLEELIYLPLAIAQAVAFMMKRRKNIRQYLESYRQNDSTRIKLLGQRFMYHGREGRPLESVVTTWWLSFNFIKTENPRAAELLSVMSFLDRQGIPDSLMINSDENTFDFDEANGLLDSFSLITRSSSGDSSNMHRLVQVAMRVWLQEYEGSAENTAAATLSRLMVRFPQGTYENWSICAMLLPHADAILHYEFASHTREVEGAKAELLVLTAAYLRRQGRSVPAKERSLESKRIRERLFGKEHEDTLNSTAEYAMTLQKSGGYREAVRLQRVVLAGREKVLGKTHRSTLETLNALGYDLRTIGEFKEAEQIHRREMREKQKLLDADPDDWGLQADLLVAINNAARMLSHQGEHAEAERMHKDALKKTIELMGPDHPDTFITLGELASNFRDQDKLEEAQSTYETLLKDRTRVLGPLHPDTLLTKSNIATLRSRQGDYNEAERLYKEVYDEEVLVLGADHPSTVNTLHNLACSSADLERNNDAVETFRKVLKLQQRLLGVQHPDTQNTGMNLAVSLYATGNREETDKIIIQAIDLARHFPEDKDPRQHRSLERLASILADQERYADAEEIRHKEMQLILQRSSPISPEAHSCRLKLGLVLEKQEKYEEGIVLYRDVLDATIEAFGLGHEQTIFTIWNLAVLLADSDPPQLEEAVALFQTLVDTKVKMHGHDDSSVLPYLAQLAWCQQQLERYVDSEKNYRWLLEAQTKIAGPEDKFTLFITNNMASVLNYQGQNEEAETLFRRAYETRAKVLGSDHPLTMKTLHGLANFLEEIGKEEEAIPLLELLPEDPDVRKQYWSRRIKSDYS